jgi:hypothetical protein
MGDKAQPIIETFARLEKGSWSLVDFLTPAQQADLRRRLAAWARMPPRWTASHTTDWPTSRRPAGCPADERKPRTGILALIGADPLAGLHPQFAKSNAVRILGERAIYYANARPMLLDLQTRT